MFRVSQKPVFKLSPIDEKSSQEVALIRFFLFLNEEHDELEAKRINGEFVLKRKRIPSWSSFALPL